MPPASSDVPAASDAPQLWRHPDFRRLWLGQTASQLGEHATLVVLPLFAVLTLDVGADQLGVLRAVGQAPVLLLSLLVGAWVDRWRTRTVMVWADAGRALVLGAAAVLALCGGLGLPALLVATFAVGALSVFFDVAYQSSLVRLVRRDQLVRGNSALEGSRSAAQIGGPALGGTLVSQLSVPVAAVFSALFFVLSFLSIRRIRRSEPVQERLARPVRTGRRIVEGLRFVAGGPLRAVCLASAAFQFFFAAMMTVYLLFLPRELHVTGAVVGLVLGDGTGRAPGLGAGRPPAGPVRPRAGTGDRGGARRRCAAVCARAARLLGADPGRAPRGQLRVRDLRPTGERHGDGVRQALTPAGTQGRAAATITFVGMGTAPLGSLLGGFLAQEWGLRTALLVTAAGMLLSPVLMAASPLARLGRVLESPAQSA